MSAQHWPEPAPRRRVPPSATCAACIELLDAVTGLTPGCAEHRGPARTTAPQPQRPEAEQRIAAARADGVRLPSAVDPRTPR